MQFPLFSASRYVTPLREGGSLPAIVETEDAGLWVVKFRGAGQGAKVLVAELVAGVFARLLGLPVPDLALVALDQKFERLERDPEIQDILRKSIGLNVGLRYLEGALNFNPAVDLDLVSPKMAARIVVFDALIMNVDRTWRNPNMMVVGQDVVLIDNGTAFYYHHNWEGVTETQLRSPFPQIKTHVLLPIATGLPEAAAEMRRILDTSDLQALLGAIPDDLLLDNPSGGPFPFDSADAVREAYMRSFRFRLETAAQLAEEAEKQGTALVSEKPGRPSYRK